MIPKEYVENIPDWLSPSIACISFLIPNRQYPCFKVITVWFAILPDLCSKYHYGKEL